MLHTLQMNDLRVKIDDVGAELCSMKKGDREYVWQADPAFWANHGPLLFPIVGRTLNDELNIGGQDCKIPTHGFLSSMKFKCFEQTPNKVSLMADFNAETLAQYPFKFRFIATYRVMDNMLEGYYHITNLDDKTMPYGFGLHNGFYCLDSQEECIEDVYLEFEKPITYAKPSRTEDNFMDFANRIPVVENSTVLSFKDEWYPKEAPVMDELNFNSFKLCHKKRGTILHYSFSDGFELFNPWRMPGSPFICLEPWSSQCGIYPCAKTLEEVENTKYLAPKESAEYTFCVRI